MNITAFASCLKTALINNWPVLVQSAPGLGKSDVVASVANELGYDLMIMHPVVQSPDDVKGLGFITPSGDAAFIPYENMRRLLTATSPLICFIDDLGQAPQSMQGAYMQLILARELDGKKLSPFVRFVSATNRRSDNAGATGLITALISRFRAVITLDVDAGAWVQWALANGVPAELVAFIKFRPDLISTFNPSKRDEQFACPRTIAALGDWVKAGVIDLEVWQGAVGEAFATEFFGFYQIYTKVAGLPAQIVMNPAKAQIPTSPDLAFALTSALAFMASEKNIDALAIYTKRLDGEFRTFFWRSVVVKKPALASTQAYITYTLENQADIQ